jgi:hypothetical protein
MKLIFNNKTIELKENENCFNECIFLKELLDCKENQIVTLNKDSLFFEKFILKCETFDLTSDDNIEKYFLELGYYGYDKRIIELKNLVKEKLKKEFTKHEDVLKLFKMLKLSDYKLLTNNNPYILQDESILKTYWINFYSRLVIITNFIFSVNFIEKEINDSSFHFSFHSLSFNIRFLNKNSKFILKYKHQLYLNIILPKLFINESKYDTEKWFREFISLSSEKEIEINKLGDFISQNPYLSEEFFLKHKNIIVWNTLAKNKNISDQFFLKYCPNITSTIIDSRCCDGSCDIEFLEKYRKSINWEFLQKRNNLNEEFIINNIDKFINNHLIFINYENISENFINKYLYNNLYYLDWRKICSESKLGSVFFDKHLNKIFWNRLYMNIHIEENYLLNYILKNPKIKYLFIDDLCLNIGLSDNFFETLIKTYGSDIIAWKELSSNKNISPQFFMKYVEKINMCNIISNYFNYYDIEGFKKYIEKSVLSKYL